MTAAEPKTKLSEQANAGDLTPAPPTLPRRLDSEPPRDSERAAAPLSEDFERHDTIPAPTWFDDATESAN